MDRIKFIAQGVGGKSFTHWENLQSVPFLGMLVCFNELLTKERNDELISIIGAYKGFLEVTKINLSKDELGLYYKVFCEYILHK